MDNSSKFLQLQSLEKILLPFDGIHGDFKISKSHIDEIDNDKIPSLKVMIATMNDISLNRFYNRYNRFCKPLKFRIINKVDDYLVRVTLNDWSYGELSLRYSGCGNQIGYFQCFKTIDIYGFCHNRYYIVSNRSNEILDGMRFQLLINWVWTDCHLKWDGYKFILPEFNDIHAEKAHGLFARIL